MSNTFDVSKGSSYAVLLSVLSVLTILAALTLKPSLLPVRIRGFFDFSPDSVKKRESGEKGGRASDWFLAARGSLSWKTITLSYFAGQIGAWCIYAPTELGAIASLSWIAVIGYALASGSPAIIILLIGGRIKEVSGDKAFSTTDFARKRFGRVMQIIVMAVSVLYMYIFIVAELTAIGDVFATIRGLDLDDARNYTISITVSVCVFTSFYCMLAGLPASIVTDKIQGITMLLLMSILFLATTCDKDNRVSKAEWNLAASWTMQGFEAAITLCIAVIAAELFNQANWQRVWAAKDEEQLKKGFLGGFVLVFLVIMFFGIMGMVALAGDYEAFATFEKLPYLSFFYLLEPTPTFFYYLTLIFISCLCASTVDSLQNAMIALFSKDVMAIARLVTGTKESAKSKKIGRWAGRVLLVAINVPAVIMSSKKYDVLSLFLVADLVCCTAALPLFLGLMMKDWGWITAPTELGSTLGCVAGVATVLVNGKIKGFTEAVNPFDPTDVWATGPFSYFWLTNGAECSLCGVSSMITFIVTPLSAGIFTLFFSTIDVLVRGERARRPLLEFLDKNFNEAFKLPQEKIESEVLAKEANGDAEKLEGIGDSDDLEINEEKKEEVV